MVSQLADLRNRVHNVVNFFHVEPLHDSQQRQIALLILQTIYNFKVRAFAAVMLDMGSGKRIEALRQFERQSSPQF